MTNEQTYQLKLVREPEDLILEAFSNRFKPRVRSFINEMESSNIKINDSGSITIQSGEVIKNIIEIIKYHIFPEFFKMSLPRNYKKVVKALKQKQNIVDETPSWICYK